MNTILSLLIERESKNEKFLSSCVVGLMEATHKRTKIYEYPEKGKGNFPDNLPSQKAPTAIMQPNQSLSLLCTRRYIR